MKVDELRSSLQEYAADVAHGGPHPRVVAVRSRVQAVRRRRRAAGVAGLAVAVVAAAAVAVPTLVGHHEPQPAGPAPGTLAGRAVPRTETALGYTYRYVRGVQSGPGDQALRVDLGRSTSPRLVMWATSDSADAPTVRVADGTGNDADRSAPGRFDRYRYLDPGTPARITLTRTRPPAGSRLALAVYDLASRRPAGAVSDGRSTFRHQVLDTTLLAARFGAPGMAVARVPFTVPASGRITFHEVCRTNGGAWSLAVAGHDQGASTCTTSDAFEDSTDTGLGTTAAELARWGYAPGDRVTATLTHTATIAGDRPAPNPGLVLGLGVYRDQTRHHTLARMQLPDASEDAGHEWIASRWVQSRPGQRRLVVTVSAGDAPRLVRVVGSSGPGRGRFRWTAQLVGPGVEGSATGFMADRGGTSSTTAGTVQPGQRVRVVVHASLGVRPGTLFGVSVSELVH